MIRPAAHLPLAAFALAAASCLAAPSARAQGTQEQQDACAPDAFKFCQATIPDIPKTTACMKAHYAQLSHRCQLAFGDATGGGSKGAPADVARGEAEAPPSVAVAPSEDDPSDAFAHPMRSYAAQIRGYCRQGLIDPFTCHNTLSLLHSEE